MATWAHQEARALLESKVEAGDLTSEAESRVREQLAAGKTTLALETLVHGAGAKPVTSD